MAVRYAWYQIHLLTFKSPIFCLIMDSMHKSSDASDLDMPQKNHKALPLREQVTYREKRRIQALQAEAVKVHEKVESFILIF